MLTDKRLVQPDPLIFMEIAAQQDRGGATVFIIREGVDYRQKVFLTDAEISEGLERLLTAKLIRTDGDLYFVAESIVRSLPRTRSGHLSLRPQDWLELSQPLFET